MKRCWHWLWCLLACAGPLQQPSTPEQLIQQYESAVLRRDVAAVYALLAPELRARLGEAEFARFFRENYSEIREEALLLSSQAQQLRHEALLPLESGETAVFLRDAGAWRLSSVGVIAHSPLQVAALLARELETSQEMTSRLFSAEAQEERRARQRVLAALLRQVTESDVRQEGEIAFVRLADGRQLQLLRTARGWLFVGISEEL